MSFWSWHCDNCKLLFIWELITVLPSIWLILECHGHLPTVHAIMFSNQQCVYRTQQWREIAPARHTRHTHCDTIEYNLWWYIHAHVHVHQNIIAVSMYSCIHWVQLDVRTNLGAISRLILPCISVYKSRARAELCHNNMTRICYTLMPSLISFAYVWTQ